MVYGLNIDFKMETREFLNTSEGFARIIEENNDSIKECYDEIVQCEDALQKGFQLYKEDNVSVILSCREDIISYYIELVFAKYSAGFPISLIREDYIGALNEMSIVFNEKTVDSFSDDDSEPYYSTDDYWEILQIVALGILLDVSEKEANQIIYIRDKVSTPDIILDFLCSYFDKRKYGYEQSIGNKYNGLAKVIQECTTNNASSIMKEYLNKLWFKDYKRQGFVTTHNCNFDIHYGYWSFESGAIMKILKADDSILKGQQFYPYDMVNWQ